MLDIDAINDGKMQILTAVPLENKKVLFGITLVIMAALCNRAGHYIFVLWFLSIFYLSFFIPRLISAAADWMSTILLHMVWPYCEFRMV